MELNVNFAIALFEKFAGADHLQEVFGLFLTAAKFTQVRFFFYDSVIADVNRHDDHVIAGPVFISIY